MIDDLYRGPNTSDRDLRDHLVGQLAQLVRLPLLYSWVLHRVMKAPKNMETPRSTLWRYLELTHKIILAVNKQKPPPLFVPWGAALITKLSHYEKLQIIRWSFFATKLPQFNTYCLPVFRIGLIALFSGFYLGNIKNNKNRITKTPLS